MQRNDEHLMDKVPALQYRRFTYDTHLEPFEGLFLVSIGKGGRANSVYQVVSVRRVKSNRVVPRWQIQVLKVQDMLQHTVVHCFTGNSASVSVCGQTAQPVFWYPRKKKG